MDFGVKNVDFLVEHKRLTKIGVDSKFNEKLGRYSSPSLDEKIEFLRHIKKVYDLGADLMTCMEKNTGA